MHRKLKSFHNGVSRRPQETRRLLRLASCPLARWLTAAWLTERMAVFFSCILRLSISRMHESRVRAHSTLSHRACCLPPFASIDIVAGKKTSHFLSLAALFCSPRYILIPLSLWRSLFISVSHFLSLSVTPSLWLSLPLSLSVTRSLWLSFLLGLPHCLPFRTASSAKRNGRPAAKSSKEQRVPAACQKAHCREFYLATPPCFGYVELAASISLRSIFPEHRCRILCPPQAQ